MTIGVKPFREIALYFGFVEPSDDERMIESARGPAYRLLRFLAVAFLMATLGVMLAVLF